MTKAERLIYLVNLIKQRGGMYVGDMSVECGVSVRTIYRDLNSLLRMNIPLHYNKGYHLSDDSSVPAMELGIDEIDLVRYALRNNPIACNPLFETKFRAIEQRLLAKKRSRYRYDGRELVLFESDDAAESTEQAALLNSFIAALIERKRVRLALHNDLPEAKEYLPVAIRIIGSEPFFVVTSDVGCEPIDIPADSVRSVTLSDRKFVRRPVQPASEESRREQIRVD